MLSIAAVFHTILTGLRAAIGAHLGRDRTSADILTLAWTRLGRTIRRFDTLFTRWQAATLPPPRPSRAGKPRAERPRQPYFPARRTWLVATIGYNAAGHASQLTHLLARPDMAEFLAAVPRAGRILRPLCHMLGIDPPAAIILPAKPRAPRQRPEKPPPPPVHHGKYTPAQIRKYRPGRISGRMAKPP